VKGNRPILSRNPDAVAPPLSFRSCYETKSSAATVGRTHHSHVVAGWESPARQCREAGMVQNESASADGTSFVTASFCEVICFSI
jgi:hypothetical protein